MTETPHRYAPGHTALIVIDVQNDFCHPEGALARLGNDVSAAVEMVPRLEKLIDEARTAALPVIFVQTLHDESNDTTQWLNRVSTEPGSARTAAICRTGSWGAGYYRLSPRSDEIVVVKHRYSAFVGTNFDIVLKSLGIRSLLFTGVTTEVCVESSIRDGLAAEYFVSLVEDGAATYTADAHHNAVLGIGRHFGTVVSSAELVALWRGVPVPASQV